jgi:hypothetical protein
MIERANDERTGLKNLSFLSSPLLSSHLLRLSSNCLLYLFLFSPIPLKIKKKKNDDTYLNAT